MYTRVFHSILDSSVWMLDSEVRVVWMTMLLLADDARTGVVDMPIASLSRRANLSERTVRKALDVLMSPDALSGDPEDEGRRVRSLSGNPDRGWVLVNWEKYKTSGNAEARKEQVKEATRKWREKAGDTAVNIGDQSVIIGDTSEAEAKAKAKAEAKASLPSGESRAGAREKKPTGIDAVLSYWREADLKGDPTAFLDHFEDKGWGKDWKAKARNWSRREGTFAKGRAGLTGAEINPDVRVGKGRDAPPPVDDGSIELETAAETAFAYSRLEQGADRETIRQEILRQRQGS